MKTRSILLMALLACTSIIRAQAPNKLQFYQMEPAYYPSAYQGDILDSYSQDKGVTSPNDANIGYYQNHYQYEGNCACGSYGDSSFLYEMPFALTDSVEFDYTASSTYEFANTNGRMSDYQESLIGFDFKSSPLGVVYIKQTADYFAKYMVELPAPDLQVSSGNGNYCAGSPVTLKSVINWANLSGIRYSYEFQRSDGNWQVLDETTNPSFTFSATSYPALLSQINPTATTSIYFRVRALTAETTGGYSAYNNVSFSPAPPSVGTVTVSDACGGGTQGIIQLSYITGMGNYGYVLQDASIPPCNPTIPGSCTSGTSGLFSGNSTTISGIVPGSYNLLIANNGGSAGACYQTIPVTVVGIPMLTQVSATHTDVSCPGGSDGSITMTMTGGKPGTVTYQLINQSTGVASAPQSTGTFDNLPAGTYMVQTSSYCGAGPNPVFALTQPTAVTGSYTQSNATCNSPGDGSVKVAVSQGSGTYNYYLYLNGAIVSSQPGSSFTSWEVDDLAPGVYNLQVLDAGRPSCAGYSVTVTIVGPPALGLTVLQRTDVSCYGALTGSISLQGSGGMNSYSYTITNTTSGGSYTNTTGVFADLAAGSYTAVVQSAVSGCGDQYVYPQPIVVSQPADLSIALNPTDVRCYGEGNGSIGATTGGGTGSLTLTWQQEVSGVWTATGGSGGTLNNLLPGLYRLSVTDANSCNKVSSVVTIAQPDTLVIPTVVMTDIVCYGGYGTITPVATGGNGGNVFAFSADGGGSFASFLPGSAFGAGSYQVRVTDSKGCTASYGVSQVITAPPSPLVFSDQLSDYHGFNISCYGATNGIVTAAASGGNGSNYNNYSYSVDGGTYQSSPVLNNLPADGHVIRVRDGRGCIVQQTETLTQPASDMGVNLLNKKDNDCADGLTGSLSVSATGGTAPYQFSKDGITYQNDGDFAELASGDYTITAMDVNGCRLGRDYIIQSLYPAITVSHSVGAVQCNGGSDGSIQLDVSGGFGAYTYQWSAGGNGNEATGLGAGTYTVHITDEKGCGIGDTAVVSQPAAMTASLTVRPVCSDATSGRVKVFASGGTPPYRYATDGGSANADSAFNELSMGQHTIWVTDSHGCSWSQAVTISVNPLVPSVDFLVATKQNVLDTLQAEDISSPKPDSVQWTFDPATLLLGSSPEGPMIRFSQTGTYPASMRAWYGGCDFSVAQNILIQPYDSSNYSAPVRAGLSIDTASIGPNPNAGNFHLYVKLYKAQRLLLTITTLSGQLVYRKQWDGQDLISEQVVLPGYIVAGAYMAELVTETDIRDYTILVTK